MRRWVHNLAFACCLPAFDAFAVELYRYENEQGVPVISYSIPPELVHKGYTVLSEDGRVIRVVERELSPTERVKRDAEESAKKHDAELQKRYSSPKDVEADLERRLGELDQSIARAKQELEQSQNRLARYQREAAEAERAGGTPTPATLDNIERSRKQIETYKKELEQRQQEREKLVEQFKKDAERVRELYDLPADD
jgi:predicted RNase H-like nuclease (RuvC/YqgF family)